MPAPTTVTTTEPVTEPVAAGRYEIPLFFALACGLTWGLDLPLALAWMRHATPAPHAVAMAGLSALGPTLAAITVAAPRGTLRGIFGRWRTQPAWILAGLLLPGALQLAATALDAALGGHPSHWLYPPARPEHVAALVMFSVGEEFGWRGFAYPRVVERFGLVAGNLLLGAVWAAWHLFMSVSPERGSMDWAALGFLLAELPLYCLVIAWLFERGGRSMAVAIAIHAGGHLDNLYRAPAGEVRLRVLHALILAVLGLLAARSLARRTPPGTAAVDT